ncbi:response regulator, partial [Paenibacillus glycinis]
LMAADGVALNECAAKNSAAKDTATGERDSSDRKMVADDMMPHALATTDSAADSASGPIAARGRAAVLVADDNEINQKLTLSLLDKLGIAADVAGNGSDAVDLAMMRHYDLILMDMRMPVMDGLEATRRVLASAPAGRAPVVVAMTANVLPRDRERCLEAGMTDFLSKPIQFDAVERLLQRCGIETERTRLS